LGFYYIIKKKGGEVMAMPVVALDVFNIKHIQRISYSRNGDNFTVVARVDDQEVKIQLPLSPDVLTRGFERRTAADGLVKTLSAARGIKFSEVHEDDIVVHVRIR